MDEASVPVFQLTVLLSTVGAVVTGMCPLRRYSRKNDRFFVFNLADISVLASFWFRFAGKRNHLSVTTSRKKV
ncbi:MAG: hypothetical protein ACK58T_08200 [Phycisphaerae bacterium]